MDELGEVAAGDACFDDARHLAHVDAVIARLDALAPAAVAGGAR